LEGFLGVKIPPSYKEILKRGSKVLDGYKILGFPSKETQGWRIKSIFESLSVMRKRRPDLPLLYLPICTRGTKALCLDLEKGNDEDAPLVEVDLQSSAPQKPLGKTFKEWIEYHEAISKRFLVAWNRVMARREEVKEKKDKRITDWKTVVFKVQDYIIGLVAYRYNYNDNCLEVDELYPVPQPHIKEDEGVRILLDEVFCGARDYCGCLKVIFTRNLREDASGKVPREFQRFKEKRTSRPIPEEIIKFAEKYGISFSEEEVNSGVISHEKAVKLWFSSLRLPTSIEEKIAELERGGYLSKEIICEIIAKGIWSKEELIWIFSNAPRPEAVVLGLDPPEDRLYYSESLSYARAAFLVSRFKYAILAGLAGREEKEKGFSMEEIEEVMRERKLKLELIPKEQFWVLKCSKDFQIPGLWTFNEEPLQVKAGEELIVSSRPCFPTKFEHDRKWIYEEINLLSKEKGKKCLLLSYEFKSPEYNRDLEKIKGVMEEALKKGVWILFAPSRMFTYLDEEIEGRMERARSLKKFKRRKGALPIRVVRVPDEGGIVVEKIKRADEMARMFLDQIIKKRDVSRFRREFSLMCEVIEREAVRGGEIIFEGVNESLTEVLDKKEYFLPYLRPDEIPIFLEKAEDRIGKFSLIFKLPFLRKLKECKNGIVITLQPWEKSIQEPIVLPQGVSSREKLKFEGGSEKRKYASDGEVIKRVDKLIKDSIEERIPFSLVNPSYARVRVHTFVEVIRDYIYEAKGCEPAELKVAYGDGTEGGSFHLFSLPPIKRPSDEDFLELKVGIVSLRHTETDLEAECSLVRNYEIQVTGNASDQEELAFRRTFEFVDELFKFIDGKISKEQISFKLKALLMVKPEIDSRDWRGLKLYVYHSTGLEPAIVGVYRAIIELLRQYRGRLVVVPKILKRGAYVESEEWY
jgi:hypothetical protein